MKLTKKIAAAALLLALAAGAFPVLAETPYETYTYSYEGDVQISPSAYTPDKKVSTFGEAGTLNAPADIIRDGCGNIVVADKENNRIVILDPQTLHSVKILDGFTGKNGQPDTFNKPQGVFSAPSGRLYVADTDNGRLVVFDKDYAYVTTIDPPSADILPESFKYNPKAVAVDKAGRIYVVSMNTNMGVIALDKNGGFEAFIGAQRVKPNLAELFWRTFMTEEQKAMTTSFVPVEYSNLTIDDKGFVYVTASSIDRYTLYNTIWTRSADSSYAPIKKINPSGTDVLSRTGFFPPVGDINFDAYTGAKEPVDPSSISEVTLMGNGMYTLVDKEYSKLFTYDSYGNLLYAFGGEGEALGLFSQLASVACDGDRLLALDAVNTQVVKDYIFMQNSHDLGQLEDYAAKIAGLEVQSAEDLKLLNEKIEALFKYSEEITSAEEKAYDEKLKQEEIKKKLEENTGKISGARGEDITVTRDIRQSQNIEAAKKKEHIPVFDVSRKTAGRTV